MKNLKLKIKNEELKMKNEKFGECLFWLFASGFSLLPTSYFLLPSPFSLLPSAFSLLASVFCLLSSLFFLLPSLFSLLPSPKGPKGMPMADRHATNVRQQCNISTREETLLNEWIYNLQFFFDNLFMLHVFRI